MHATLLLLLAVARADEAPDPEIVALVQEGQDVHATLWSVWDTLGRLFLTAVRGEEEVTSSLDLSNLQADCSGPPWCHADVACHDDPTDCYDCDGDGVAECPNGDTCEPTCWFEAVDPCVAPGKVEYRLVDGSGDRAGNGMTLTVVDRHDPCLEPPGDTGGPDGPDDEAGDHGCAQAGGNPGAFLASAFLGLGLVVFRVSRRSGRHRSLR